MPITRITLATGAGSSTDIAMATQRTASQIAAAVPWCSMNPSDTRSMWASHPGSPAIIPSMRSWSAWGDRPAPTTESTASKAHQTIQMTFAARTPMLCAATNGLPSPSLGHRRTANTA